MRRLLSAIAVVLLPAAQASPGQDAENAFHAGARVYVDGKLEEAADVVDAALAVSPDDPKLLALKALIDQEKERQQQSGEGNSEQQRQEENKDRQPQPNQSGDEQEPQDQESGEGQQQEEEQQQGQGDPSPEEPTEDQEAPDREQQSVDSGDNPDQLSRAQAIRILQALQNEEEQLLREVQKIKGRPRRVEKDW